MPGINIGLTGGIASGKSTVALFFKELGIEILSADAISRELTLKGKEALDEIVVHFGSSILNQEGSLNRKVLRNLIFNNPKERLWLNNYLHPLIRKEIKRQVQNAKGPYLIIEIPLLNNRSDYPYLDRILTVITEEETQIERIIERDKASTDEAKAILASQINHEQRKKLADDVIYNNGNIDTLKTEVLHLHQKYLKLSALKG